MPALPKLAAPSHGHLNDEGAAQGEGAVTASGRLANDAVSAHRHAHGHGSAHTHALHHGHSHSHAPGQRHPMAEPGFSLLRLSVWQRLAIALPLTVLLWAAAIAVISGGGL
ncbi:hypothetical protein [Ancylobacter sp. SL191]|uniref:hypothetical protein n=1 Tax=Ancylobacter sp. SL191 TaxID=2995166 RepID=UPI0022701A99|nr:hypothetical protein [Ancylobacter sp. SL191]WAC29073.1 hypothetical protein OU996_08640 [Ancylobacter sp. SL191]